MCVCVKVGIWCAMYSKKVLLYMYEIHRIDEQIVPNKADPSPNRVDK